MHPVHNRAMTAHAYLYLASQSPRRAQLLDQLGVSHELLLPDDAEDAERLEAVLPGEDPLDYVLRVTRAKLRAARERLLRRAWPAAPVLCSDTTVALGAQILGKPQDAADAQRMLSLLSGRTHQVLTAVAVYDGRRTRVGLSRSQVKVARLPVAVIEAYVASGEPFGKAGAYAVQSGFAGWIERIQGSYSGIMGLPLHETAQLLMQSHVRMALWNPTHSLSLAKGQTAHA